MGLNNNDKITYYNKMVSINDMPYDILELIADNLLSLKDFSSFIQTNKKNNELKNYVKKYIDYFYKTFNGRRHHCITEYVATTGHLDSILWFHNNNHIFTNKVMDISIENGHYDVVKFLYENREEKCSSTSIRTACKNGHFNIIKLLSGLWIDLKLHDEIYQSNNFEMMKWYYKNISDIIPSLAIENENLEVVQWIYDKCKYKKNKHTMTHAINVNREKGNFHIANWLIGKGHQGTHEIDKKHFIDNRPTRYIMLGLYVSALAFIFFYMISTSDEKNKNIIMIISIIALALFILVVMRSTNNLEDLGKAFSFPSIK
jgi:hypothetical protein